MNSILGEHAVSQQYVRDNRAFVTSFECYVLLSRSVSGKEKEEKVMLTLQVENLPFPYLEHGGLLGVPSSSEVSRGRDALG